MPRLPIFNYHPALHLLLWFHWVGRTFTSATPGGSDSLPTLPAASSTNNIANNVWPADEEILGNVTRLLNTHEFNFEGFINYINLGHDDEEDEFLRKLFS